MRQISIACIGCGSRGRTYLSIAASMNKHYKIVAAADPSEDRLEAIRELSGNPDFTGFKSDDEILAEPKLADLMIIATQDSMHVKACLLALKRGYDILVEKPVATNIEDVLLIEKCARKYGRRVQVCHVLRYGRFYKKVHEIIEEGTLGDVVSIHMSEGVTTFHQAHSYVRGHWGVKEKSSPMIIAKSCHDLDILCWLVDSDCVKVSSFGGLSYFNESNMPQGAPSRCTGGCPVVNECEYNANLYKSTQRAWLNRVWPTCEDVENISDERITEWLKASPWGRCVYRCDNNVVDHQVVNMQFTNDVTASFTMTAFDSGRNIEIFGTKGYLRGGDALKKRSGSDIVVNKHFGNEQIDYSIDCSEESGGYDGHGGGDYGLIKELYYELLKEPEDMKTSIHASVISHIIGFAAEESRLKSEVILIKKDNDIRQVM